MNLLKQSKSLDRLLKRNPIQIIARDYSDCFLIRPMPLAAIDYNHAVYFSNGSAYIITPADPRYRLQAEIVID